VSGGILSCHDAYHFISSAATHWADAIITDPPYEIGVAGESWDQVELNIPFFAYHFHRTVKPTGNVFVFCSDRQFGRWYDCLNEYFDNITKFAWHSTNPLPRGKRFISSIEFALHAFNAESYFNPDKKGAHNFFESGRTGGSERLMKPEAERAKLNKGQKSLHPTQKPLSLMKYLVECLTTPGDFVIDPFSGVFSTAVACKELGRDYWGTEYYLEYWDAGRERINAPHRKSQKNELKKARTISEP
jgi:DNA modification methylase